ncbi:MAG TPA: amino acid ABC transporter substrate-binding protein [Casimicrobiaceae bacterium]|nr:amino acid ABC transporter substrate-binding protein [Casimicrobiaceae bacterium]
MTTLPRFVIPKLSVAAHWRAVAAGLAIAGAGLLAANVANAQSPTLDAIVKRGELLCSGATVNSPGFAVVDAKGEWSGLDVDMCHALAAAILGDEKKMKLVPVSFVQRFPALQNNTIDIIVKNTAMNLTRNTELGLMFSWPYLFTGNGIMVYKSLGVTRGADLDGATICTSAGTTLEKATADFFTKNNKKYKLLAFENGNERDQAYLAKRCDAIVNGFEQLAAIRAFSAPKPEDHVILPDALGKEIQGAVVRQGDDRFLNVVNWTIFAMIEAEELGITSQNVDARKSDADPRVQKLLGVVPGVGKKLGLRETWAYDVIKQVGNYGEVYNRNLGQGSALKLDRRYNKPWNQGGVMYSPPFD